jgi:secondary thiamine-phosphate synthase enzyme
MPNATDDLAVKPILTLFIIMRTVTHFLKFTTTEFLSIIDITDQVKKVINESAPLTGLVNIFCRHTTATIKINENETGFFNDLKKFCRQFAPPAAEYDHNQLHQRDPKTICTAREECLNGHSHILQMFIGTASETIPLVDGKLMLGTWQRVLLLELDGGREREVVVQVISS